MKFSTNKIRLTAAIMTASVLFSSCASTTYINSYPSGADLYLNGEIVGQTPYAMTDTKPSLSCTSVKIEKDDYLPLHTTICRDEEADVGAIIGGVFFLVPFLWTLKYKTEHNYKLLPIDEEKGSFDQLIENNPDEK